MARKKAIRPGFDQTPKISTNSAARPKRQVRERLQSTVLEDLWSIWQANPRVPSIKSRHSWAISRNANPRLVDCWFLRRRACAKKAGQPVPDESYDLPLDLPIASKREPSITPFLDIPSDDTLVYPPDVDDLYKIETSSDTVFDEDALVDSKGTETRAYMEMSRPEHYPSQPETSIPDFHAANDPCDGAISFGVPSFPVCNDDPEKRSDCILCSATSGQGDTSISRNKSAYMCPSNRLPGEEAPFDAAISDTFTPHPDLDFLPDTLSELSAIPFLYRTPHTVLPADPIPQSSVDWTAIEDELARLVNDGQLNFSFLDVPHLASMALVD